ncbi:MAG: ABC transporter permease, partial [Thermoanaerobaculia bacterium]
FFPMLGVRPVEGRLFAAGEDEIGARPVALVGEDLWRRKFAGAPGAVAGNLVLDGNAFTVVGVIPAGFDLTLNNANRPEAFLPIGQWGNPLLTNRGAGLGIHGIGRLKPGVPLARAREDLNRVARNLAIAYPEKDEGIGATLIPLREQIVGNIQPFLLALLAAVGFVLLIACVNVANLLLARSASRSREFGIRAALGAGKGRLVRQLLTESILLSLAGGGLGLLLASRGTRAALGLLGSAVPGAARVGIDGRVLAFTTAVSLLAGILFGLAPSLRSSRSPSQESLKDGGRGAIGARHRAQNLFVVLELAMALILLIGAGLMIRTLSRLWRVDPGFDTDNLLTFNVALSPELSQAPPAAIRAALREIDEKLASSPGVAASSYSWAAFPIGWDDEILFWPEGELRPANSNDMSWALKYVVEPGYRKAMGLRLVRGRFLKPGDDEKSPLVAVVDDVFARTYFGNADPIGKRLSFDDFRTPATIVGVVGHVRQWGLDTDDSQKLRAQLYLSTAQMPDGVVTATASGMTVAVRCQGPPALLGPSMRRLLRNDRSGQVVYGMKTMREIVSDSLAARRYSMMLLGAFAALALVLSAIGIYGVVSFVVGQRKGEIGIRIALGAQRRDILRMIVREGGKLAAAGIGLGVLGAIALTRLMSRLLFGVGALDPATFAGMAAVLASVALLACYLPARAAAKHDPIVVLRAE